MSDVAQKIPLRKALFYVFLSVCLIWGSLYLAWWYHNRTLKKRQTNPLYTITKILQTSKNRPLPTWQLAELVGLSQDIHTNLYTFDTALAKQRLLACPVISKAHVRRVRPGIIHIDYETKEAKALIADYDNMACDGQGIIFPLSPYFSPKKLPEVYIGSLPSDQEMAWNKRLQSEKLTLALEVIDFVSARLPSNISLLRVDVQKAFSLSTGEREMVLLFERGACKQFVRLPVHDFKPALAIFLQLQPELEKMRCVAPSDAQIVDMRSPGIALVK